MPTSVSGTNGVDKVVDGTVDILDLATAVKPLGAGQTWQDVTASRAVATQYTNSTGRPIEVLINLSLTDNQSVTFTLNGIAMTITNSSGTTGSQTYPLSFTVPDGNTYQLSAGTISKWLELR